MLNKCLLFLMLLLGATPLLFAALGEAENVVTYLISKNADLNKANNLGITPLHIAAQRGNCRIAKLLLSKGAMVDPLSQDGEAPLHVAAHNEKADMVTLLLEHNADYNRLSHKCHTPLVESLFGPSLECLEILIQAGADVNAGSHVTPLTVAADKGLANCINLLLRENANPNKPNAIGKMPIEIAASKGWTECVEILFPVTNSLAKYAGMNVDEIVQLEKSVLSEALDADTNGDFAYKQMDYALALECYTQALNLGYYDTALYAKRSLCHLALHNKSSALEDAYAYRDFMQPGLSDVPTDNAVIRLVLAYGKKFREQLAASIFVEY